VYVWCIFWIYLGYIIYPKYLTLFNYRRPNSSHKPKNQKPTIMSFCLLVFERTKNWGIKAPTKPEQTGPKRTIYNSCLSFVYEKLFYCYFYSYLSSFLILLAFTLWLSMPCHRLSVHLVACIRAKLSSLCLLLSSTSTLLGYLDYYCTCSNCPRFYISCTTFSRKSNTDLKANLRGRRNIMDPLIKLLKDLWLRFLKKTSQTG
jgi:hypothetical protein